MNQRILDPNNEAFSTGAALRQAAFSLSPFHSRFIQQRLLFVYARGFGAISAMAGS